MALVWGAYTKLGEPVAEFPALEVKSSLSTIIGRADSVSVQLPGRDRMPGNWEFATRPLRTVLAAVEWGEGVPYVVWAGWVEKRQYGSGPYVELTLQPAEGWLARNYISAGEYRNRPYTSIARGIGLDRLAEDFGGQVYETTGERGDRTYESDQDMTCLTGLQNLMRSRRGCEFSTRWTMSERGTLGLEVFVADHIGRGPHDIAYVFTNNSWSVLEDFSDGKGATVFTGTANREGDVRYTYTNRVFDYLNNGYLHIERRWAPDTGSKNPDIIHGYVDAALEAQKDGTHTYSIEAHIDDCLPTRDFQIGDTVEVDLTNPNVEGVGRTIRTRLLGWVADPHPVSGEITKIKPILQGVNDGN